MSEEAREKALRAYCDGLVNDALTPVGEGLFRAGWDARDAEFAELTRERDAWKARAEVRSDVAPLLLERAEAAEARVKELEALLAKIFEASAPYIIQSSPNVFVAVRAFLSGAEKETKP